MAGWELGGTPLGNRFAAATGLVPVEFPTTRRLGATPEDRAADINAAFADPTIRAILATIGGDDQITVIPHVDAGLALAHPKLFLGYSDNTNVLNWLWSHGISGFYGGSTQVHLGPGPGIDEAHLASLTAALITGGQLAITDPGESEDFGKDWRDPEALTEFGEREPTEPWAWARPERNVSGRTWGGCLEVIDGERGILNAVHGVLVARAPTSNFDYRPEPEERGRLRAAQRDAVIDVVTRYNPEAVVCVGIPFGHTRPQMDSAVWRPHHPGRISPQDHG
jgi:muramoyltetrapeptide carboxypeptidase LdcA involved in peptidoglycan recycling